MTQFRVRRAQPEDAPFLAWVMLTASRCHVRRGVWDLIIGADDAGCLDYLQRLAVAEPRSLCHWESCWVAEAGGQPGAALCTFNLGGGAWSTVGEAMANVQRDLGWSQRDLEASHERAQPAWACFLADIGADWCIEHVATKPEFRRQGLVQALLERALLQGRALGCTLAQISTFIGNEPAIRAYEKAGFAIHDEKRCPDMEAVLGTPGFVRLTRAL